MVLFAKVVLSTLALLPFFCFYRKTFRTTLALLLLRDHSRGVAERLFEYKEGKQRFW